MSLRSGKPGISSALVLAYLIARGGKMHDRVVRQAQQQHQEFRQYVQQAAASSVRAAGPDGPGKQEPAALHTRIRSS